MRACKSVWHTPVQCILTRHSPGASSSGCFTGWSSLTRMGASEDTTRAAFWVFGMRTDMFRSEGEGDYAETFYTGAPRSARAPLTDLTRVVRPIQDHMTVIGPVLVPTQTFQISSRPSPSPISQFSIHSRLLQGRNTSLDRVLNIYLPGQMLSNWPWTGLREYNVCN